MVWGEQQGGGRKGNTFAKTVNTINRATTAAGAFSSRNEDGQHNTDVLPLLGPGAQDGQQTDSGSSSNSSSSSTTVINNSRAKGCKGVVQRNQQQMPLARNLTNNINSNSRSNTQPFDIETAGPFAGSSVRERQQQQQQEQQQERRKVSRPSRRRTLLAIPTPFVPITDPFALVCDIARRPKFGHQYILCPGLDPSRRSRGERVGLSVGPHWSGVIYTISLIGMVTLFLLKCIMNEAAFWCKLVAVACSLVTTGLLLATAVADPGIVVESAEGGEGREYCEECSIFRPEGADHCEECGVCIYGIDHHCPFMGKCVASGNMLWFQLFNLSWMVFLSLLFGAMPYINKHKGTSDNP